VTNQQYREFQLARDCGTLCENGRLILDSDFPSIQDHILSLSRESYRDGVKVGLLWGLPVGVLLMLIFNIVVAVIRG
jgi:hypothetical protein